MTGARTATSIAFSPLSMRKNFSWTLLSNALYGLYQWVLVAVIARLAGPETVGQFALGLAIVTPVQMFFNLQLRALQASDAAQRHPFAHYLTLRLYTIGASAAVAGILSILWPLSTAGQRAVWGVLAIKAVESVSDVVYGAFQQAERMDISSRARMLESSGGVTVFTLVLWASGYLWLALASIAVVLVAVLAFYTYPRLTALQRKEKYFLGLIHDRVALRELFLSALPLGITMGLLNLNAVLPRLALGFFESEFEVGIFAGFTQLVISGTIVVGALGQAVTPVLARYAAHSNFPDFRALLHKLVVACLGIGIVATAGAYLVGDSVVGWIYTSEYSAYHGALVILAASSGFTFAASMQGYALTAARIIAPQVWLFVAVAIVTSLSLVVLVPLLGISGAAWAVFFGALTQLLLSRALLRWRVETLVRQRPY